MKSTLCPRVSSIHEEPLCESERTERSDSRGGGVRDTKGTSLTVRRRVPVIRLVAVQKQPQKKPKNGSGHR